MVFVAQEIVAFSMAHEGVRPDQVECIPYGIEPDDGDRAEAAAALRRQYGGGARTIIGMVARLHPQKAHDDLLAAFATASAASPDLRLWLIGDGPERARLTALVQQLGLQDRVFLAGDRNDVRDWIAAMDIFVHPTHFEGLPIAVLEAMSGAKPVIATAVDGLRGLIASGVHGWLVAPRDTDALARAISYVIDHREEAARIARAGAERVRTAFGVEREIGAYDKLFNISGGCARPFRRRQRPAMKSSRAANTASFPQKRCSRMRLR